MMCMRIRIGMFLSFSAHQLYHQSQVRAGQPQILNLQHLSALSKVMLQTSFLVIQLFVLSRITRSCSLLIFKSNLDCAR